MVYVPGFENDVFVSYAHGDDRAWIREFSESLASALKEQLGVDPTVWIDKETLDKSQDYRKEIPQSVLASALFLILASPSYVQSRYCVEMECRAFERTIDRKREQFNNSEFRNELFTFRSTILPVDNNEHWELIEGAADYEFHDGVQRLSRSKAKFKVAFRELVRDASSLLKRMRNHRTPVFLYPRDPGAGIVQAHHMLKNELIGHGYRVLPDSLLQMKQRMHESALAVFLLDQGYDPHMLELMQAMANQEKKLWVVWESPAALATTNQDQKMLLARVDQRLKSSLRRYFDSKIRPDQLKREVMDLLKPEAGVVSAPSAKRRVALICDGQRREELANASDIRYRWGSEFDFTLPSEDLLPRTAGSDAVLLVWGRAEESWCSDQFERLSASAAAKGLCVFDPEKHGAVQQIRESLVGAQWHISEHYGRLEPTRLEPFFEPLRSGGGAL